MCTSVCMYSQYMLVELICYLSYIHAPARDLCCDADLTWHTICLRTCTVLEMIATTR